MAWLKELGDARLKGGWFAFRVEGFARRRRHGCYLCLDVLEGALASLLCSDCESKETCPLKRSEMGPVKLVPLCPVDFIPSLGYLPMVSRGYFGTHLRARHNLECLQVHNFCRILPYDARDKIGGGRRGLYLLR